MDRKKIGGSWSSMRMGMKHPAINLTGLFPGRELPDGRQDFGVLLQDQGVAPPVTHLIWDENEWKRVQREGTAYLRTRVRRPDEDEEIRDFMSMQPIIGQP
jgi:hypothetical protein